MLQKDTTKRCLLILLSLLIDSAWGMIDIGLRVYDGTKIVTIACEPEGAVTSPLRIAKEGVIYGILLVDPGVPIASKIVIQTDEGPKAMAEFCEASELSMVLIPRGEFEMGDHFGVGWYDEHPVHPVLVDEFYMGKYEVTNQQYCDFLNSALSQGLIKVHDDDGVVLRLDPEVGGKEEYCDTYPEISYIAFDWNGLTFTVLPGRHDHPMIKVTWYGAAAYCNWRSEQDGYETCYDVSSWECDFTKNGYRLPTEAEWEYAARGGYYDSYYQYPWASNTIDSSKANYDSSNPADVPSFPYTSPVGYYPAYGYGLCDMAGNVYEWCNDWYDPDYYESSPYNNPMGPTSGDRRVLRGGSWEPDLGGCRSADRRGSLPRFRSSYRGFRIVLDLSN